MEIVISRTISLWNKRKPLKARKSFPANSIRYQDIHWLVDWLFLPSAMKLRRLCFYTCLSVHRGRGSASVHTGMPPPPRGAGTLPGAGTPLDQAPPQSRHPPLGPSTPQQTATVADGTHPTGIHSCFLIDFFVVKRHTFFLFLLHTMKDIWNFALQCTLSLWLVLVAVSIMTITFLLCRKMFLCDVLWDWNLVNTAVKCRQNTLNCRKRVVK